MYSIYEKLLLYNFGIIIIKKCKQSTCIIIILFFGDDFSLFNIFLPRIIMYNLIVRIDIIINRVT